MALFFILLIGQPILIGYVAQKHFGKIGIVWAGVAFALMLLIIFMVDSGQQNDPRYHLDATHRAWVTSDFQMGVTAGLAALISAAITLVILWTLPAKKA